MIFIDFIHKFCQLSPFKEQLQHVKCVQDSILESYLSVSNQVEYENTCKDWFCLILQCSILQLIQFSLKPLPAFYKFASVYLCIE